MNGGIQKALFSGTLKIKNLEIPCYVLENGERILSTRGVMKSLGRPWRGRKNPGTKLPVFLEAKNFKPYIPNELDPVLTLQRFRSDRGAISEGYRAEMLPAICDVILKARDAGVLKHNQFKIAERADIILRGLATVGIIALIDEATGYQEVRDRHALEKILERWISKELLPWTKTFPDEFYQKMFELNGWPYDPTSVKRPRLIGKWTNDFVYERLETGVLNRLREKTPKDSSGRFKKKLFQSLTHDFGYIKLREHLAGVIALMRVAPNWGRFKNMLNRVYPRKGATLELPLEDE